MSTNNYISVSSRDVQSLEISYQDEVRVFLIRTDLDREIKPNDRATYKTTLAKSDQIYVPKDVRDQLDLEGGSLVKYVIIPGDKFPGLTEGPIRDKFRQLFTGIDEDDEVADPDEERPTATQCSATFSAPMAQSGQVTVPEDVKDALGLIKGDTTRFVIKNPETGDTLQASIQIKTGNRITIVKDQRQELGLVKGDEPQILVLAPEGAAEQET